MDFWNTKPDDLDMYHCDLIFHWRHFYPIPSSRLANKPKQTACCTHWILAKVVYDKRHLSWCCFRILEFRFGFGDSGVRPGIYEKRFERNWCFGQVNPCDTNYHILFCYKHKTKLNLLVRKVRFLKTIFFWLNNDLLDPVKWTKVLIKIFFFNPWPWSWTWPQLNWVSHNCGKLDS